MCPPVSRVAWSYLYNTERKLTKCFFRYLCVHIGFHSVTLCFQTERAFQKQPTVFLNKKRTLLSGKGGKKLRYVKNIGLGFKTPSEVSTSGLSSQG